MEREIILDDRYPDEKFTWLILNGVQCTDYLISNNGRILSRKRYKSFKEMKSKLNQPLPKGYLVIGIRKNMKRHWRYIHRLVAEAFIPNLENKPEVNHRNGNKLNNWDWNLEWSTASENMKHAFDTGLHPVEVGVNAPYSKLSDAQVQLICKMLEDGERPCDIAEFVGTTRSNINCIKQHRTWRHISKDYVWSS